MPEPRRPSQDELLNKLLTDKDDRPWKLAVSYILGDVIAENRDLQERMKKAERMYMYAVGGIFLLTVIMLPLAAAFVQQEM